MKKSIWARALWITGIIFTVFNFTTCASLASLFQEPKVSLNSVELAEINFTGIKLLCKVNVNNPNPIGIPVPDIDWELFVNANSFVSGQIKAGQSIQSRRTTVVEVPVSFDYREIFQTFVSLKDNKQAGYKIALDVKFSLPVLGDKVWNFDYEGVFPVLQMPKFSAPSFKIDHLDFTKAELLFTVNVENPNPFDIPSPKMAYDYFVNNNSFIKSSVELTAPIAAAAVTAVPIRLTVNYTDLYKTFQSLLNTGEVPGLLSLNTNFNIPAFSNEPRRVDIPGSLPLLKMPSLSFGGIKVKNISLSKIDFEASWDVENKNTFAMDLKDLSYNLKINNSQWASGKAPGTPKIAANKKTSVPVEFSISSLSMIKDITEMITKGTNVSYVSEGNMRLGMGLAGLSDLNSPFNFSGTTKLAK